MADEFDDEERPVDEESDVEDSEWRSHWNMV